MNQLTSDKLRRNLTITGSSSVMGGIYNHVKIVGEGVIEGDTDCNRLKCVGTLEVNGSVAAEQMSIVGTSDIKGRLQGGTLKTSGTVTIGGTTRLRELNIAGAIESKDDVYSEQIKLKGMLQTAGDCEAETFTARGIFQIGGLLNAGQLTVRLYRDCSAHEIGGGQIIIRKARLLHPLSLFFKPFSSARLKVSILEGDHIYLENTIADIVRGKHIVIGPGCEIGLVEYKEHLEQRKDAVVREKRKV
jgi:Integral membrane protein CcmA involved in cell shape determination